MWLGHHLAMPWPAQSSSWIHTLYIYLYQIFLSIQLLNCDFAVFSVHVTSIACMSWERDPFSVALPEVSSIFFFLNFFFLSTYQKYLHSKFVLTEIEGLRTDNVIHCADCKAH